MAPSDVEIEENNGMGKTRDIFKKIRDTRGTFHAKMGSMKDRNGMDLTEAEDIKKRWQEYTEELYKKDLHDPDNPDGVITDRCTMSGTSFLISYLYILYTVVCLYVILTIILTIYPFPSSPLVNINLFSMCMTPFLFCKYII